MAAKVTNSKPQLPKRKHRYGIIFDESIAGVLPARTYRSEKEIPKTTFSEVFIRAIATVISVLLVLRLFTSFGLPTTLPLVNALNTLTNPLIEPFRLVFSSVSVAAFFTLIAVLVIAPVLIHRLRDQSESY